ncbi:unnamed protein product [Cuscuta epithymum]|uniref:Uncharacterized protein n=1 Tax=Cuscuta epithymum TaxID=186058 RepID=A0AAV0EZ59_9ASTE|nr:unnamed protein product [Cuscuta epithymum]
MGGVNSKVEEDKALQLCDERKKIVSEAVDGRCLLAANHTAYLEALKTTGINFRKFVELDTTFETSPVPLETPGGAESDDEFNLTSLPPLRRLSSRIVNGVIQAARESTVETMVGQKDLFSSIKDIECLFIQAADSGREVPQMLEANEFHFHPILSPGDEPAQTSVKYLTWHGTMSSPSSSLRVPHDVNSTYIENSSNQDVDDFCMKPGSHALTLDRLFAWEKKLYDEVQGCAMVRRVYDERCKVLRELESRGESSGRIDNVRAVVKDLHSSLGVAIARINSVSRTIEDLRDNELQPQLEGLIQGFASSYHFILRRMWEIMLESHRLQHQIISASNSPGNMKISFINSSDSRREIIIHLENELTSLSSIFTNWISAQKTYVESINTWLTKCVLLEEKSSRRRRRSAPPLRKYGPPVYVICGVWLEMFESLPTKDVVDAMGTLASEVTRFLPPSREKTRENPSGDHSITVSFDRFNTGLAVLLGQLSKFADSSLKMFSHLLEVTQDAKSSYAGSKS